MDGVRQLGHILERHLLVDRVRDELPDLGGSVGVAPSSRQAVIVAANPGDELLVAGLQRCPGETCDETERHCAEWGQAVIHVCN